jgi:hypothetical protein
MIAGARLATDLAIYTGADHRSAIVGLSRR